jgi:hypothetical protein
MVSWGNQSLTVVTGSFSGDFFKDVVKKFEVLKPRLQGDIQYFQICGVQQPAGFVDSYLLDVIAEIGPILGAAEGRPFLYHQEIL